MNSAMGAASLALYAAVGSDRFLRPGEANMKDVPAWFGSVLWQTYTWQFGGFTGATLDPLFHRLDLALPTGRVVFAPETSVVIVGTGASLEANLSPLVACRDRLCLVTSLRGAAALARAGLTPDLVLVEHASALDAQIAMRHAVNEHWTPSAFPDAWIALERRTPPELATRLAGPRTFVLDRAPTWGVWPATAAALAVASDVRTIGLVGVDLGNEAGPDPRFRPMLELLSAIARLPGSAAEAFDCGAEGVTKQGWTRHALEAVADRSLPEAPAVTLADAEPENERLVAEAQRLLALAPVVKVARLWLEAALRTRDGKATGTDRAVLQEAASGLMAWAGERQVRHTLIDTLGVSFLPRLWRHGVLDTPVDRLWRPLALALHELVSQSDKLHARIAASARRPLSRVNGKSPVPPTRPVARPTIAVGPGAGPDSLLYAIAQDVSAAPAGDADREPLLRRAISDGRPVIIFGAGSGGRKVLEHLHRLGGDAVAFVDNAADRFGPRLLDKPVLHWKPVPRWKDTFVIVASTHASREIAGQLESIALVEGRDFIRYF